MQEDPPSIEELRTFIAVADFGSFAEAARHMGRDTSVLSRRINALERRLGVRLLARTTRAVVLTEAGEQYHRRVQTILEELEAASRDVSDIAVTPRGLLRVSMPLAFGRRWIAPLLPGFAADFPEIRVDVRFSDRHVDPVPEGFDLTLRVGQLADSACIARRIGTYRTMLVAAPAYLAARGVPERPEDLGEHACLCFTGHVTWPRWPLSKGGRRVMVEPKGPIISDSAEILVDAAVAGAGIILAPDWHVIDHLRRGELVELLPGWSAANDGPINVILPPGRIVPAKVRVFIDRAAEHLREGWDWERAAGSQG
ncbi:LysR substrate-binding domain-containing protein [Paenirhodobacter sp.]|uniref:LysR family transcriptional regulator n=1 Tax=Paenirhodobacter sp. TaxID=1965326 RepID=UPI003B42624D